MECIADNICSPLGWTTNENFARVMHGESKLTRHDGKWNLPRPFVASLFPDGAIAERFSTISTDAGRYTRFEQLAILSISYALAQTHIDAADKRVLFVLSTTKGNVELLDDENQPSIPRERIRLGKSAAVIARFFGNPNQPVVVSNACISGVCAQATAHRLMQSGRYTHAVVCGCDVQSKFIVSGFQSFKALSSEPCRPFDAHRTGLNLGEAAATMILRADESAADGWTSGHIAIRNDANHISGPSRTGEGSFRALRRVLPDDTACLAFVNLHGTATPYNDEMESFAIARAGLLHTPVNALKGYYGHTMGAAGVLETILSMRAVEAGTIIPTRGFGTLGVSNKLNIISRPTSTHEREFIKLLSGFGGCNAAVRWVKGSDEASSTPTIPKADIISRVHLCSESVELNGRPVITSAKGSALLAELYKQVAVNYPKFYKMDALSRLGFIASELLLSDIDRATLDDCAVMLVGRTGCLLTDQKYQATIQHTEQFYPSPATFVYTLSNIVTGEIAIRNKMHGETSFFILENKEPALVDELIRSAFADSETRMVLGGWIEYESADRFEATLGLYKRHI